MLIPNKSLDKPTESNLDEKTVAGFGQEWSSFDQSKLQSENLRALFEKYFAIFPWTQIDSQKAVGADFGCGSGRWAKFVLPKVAHLHLIDASPAALSVAKRMLENSTTRSKISFHLGSVETAKIADASLDFAFSLGVLHHLPNTQKAIEDIALKLKPGAPFLIYLYYSFDNRPKWYRLLWRLSEIGRKIISSMPYPLRLAASQLVAFTVYWPLARFAHLLDLVDVMPSSFPLSFYRNQPFYVMRNDALDRFGTRLEKRFSRQEIRSMLERAGFEKTQFSNQAPYWCAVAIKGNSACQ